MDIITAPFSIILRVLTELFNNYGLALLAFALVITVIRLPFDIKGKRGTMGTSLLAPKVKAIQEKFAGNQQKIQMETGKLYKEEGVKPMGGCLWNIVPMLILLLLFQIIRQPLTHLMGLDQEQIDALRYAMNNLYYAGYLDAPIGTGGLYQVQMAGYLRGENFQAFRAAVELIGPAPQLFEINMNFLGMNIGQTPDFRVWTFFGAGLTGSQIAAQLGLASLPVLSTISAYGQQKLMTATSYMPQPGQQMQMMKTMMLVMPLMSLWIGFTFPAAMSIYWIVSSLTFAIASVFTNRYFKKIFLAMQAEMEARDKQKQAEIEEKRRRTAELKAQGVSEKNKGTSKKKKQLQDRERERQRQAAQRAELEPEKEEEVNPSREGHRKFARGRAYDPERFDGADADSDLDPEDDAYLDDDYVDADEDNYDYEDADEGEDDDYEDYEDEDEDYDDEES